MKRRSLLISLGLFVGASNAIANVDWAGYVVRSFEELGSDLTGVKQKAKPYSSPKIWRRVSDFDVAAAGAGACAIPVAAYAALPVEFVYLMRQIYNSAMGIGFIINGSATRADFANILAVWSGELPLDDASLKTVYEISEAVAKEIGEQAAESVVESTVAKTIKRLNSSSSGSLKEGNISTRPGKSTTGTQHASGAIVSNVLAEKAGAKTAGKLGTKVAAKTGAKIGAKYAAKATTAWIPVVSALVCGGVNAWIMNSILDSAELYFTKLGDYRKKRYGKIAR